MSLDDALESDSLLISLSLKLNLLPTLGSDSNQISPPYCSTKCLVIISPSPIPFVFCAEVSYINPKSLKSFC